MRVAGAEAAIRARSSALRAVTQDSARRSSAPGTPVTAGSARAAATSRRGRTTPCRRMRAASAWCPAASSAVASAVRGGSGSAAASQSTVLQSAARPSAARRAPSAQTWAGGQCAASTRSMCASPSRPSARKRSSGPRSSPARRRPSASGALTSRLSCAALPANRAPVGTSRVPVVPAASGAPLGGSTLPGPTRASSTPANRAERLRFLADLAGLTEPSWAGSRAGAGRGPEECGAASRTGSGARPDETASRGDEEAPAGRRPVRGGTGAAPPAHSGTGAPPRSGTGAPTRSGTGAPPRSTTDAPPRPGADTPPRPGADTPPRPDTAAPPPSHSPTGPGPPSAPYPSPGSKRASRSASSAQRASARRRSSRAHARCPCRWAAAVPSAPASPRSRSATRVAARSRSRTMPGRRRASSPAAPGRMSRAARAARYAVRSPAAACRGSVPGAVRATWSSTRASTTSHGGVSVPSTQARIPRGSRAQKTWHQPPPGSSPASSSPKTRAKSATGSRTPGFSNWSIRKGSCPTTRAPLPLRRPLVRKETPAVLRGGYTGFSGSDGVTGQERGARRGRAGGVLGRRVRAAPASYSTLDPAPGRGGPLRGGRLLAFAARSVHDSGPDPK